MSAQPSLWQQRSRGDRTVRRVQLHLPAGASSHRAGFLLEEALRLLTLPGEGEGRVYYFRHVRLQTPPSTASRKLWIERSQTALHTLATRAVHATDNRAGSVESVYFLNDQEALAWLLGRILRSPSNTYEPQAWFVPLISGAGSHATPVQQAIAVIERLRLLPSGWFAASTALLAAIESDPSAAITHLAAIPERILQTWLLEIGSRTGQACKALPCSPRWGNLLLQCITALEPNSIHQPHAEPHPLLLWFASVVVAAEHPSELARGAIVAYASALLQTLLLTTSSDFEKHIQPYPSRPALPDSVLSLAPRIPEALIDLPIRLNISQPTQAAGFYFLLNVLKHLGIAQALENTPPPLAQYMLPRLIQSLAHTAKVPSDDPAVLWANLQIIELPPLDNIPLIEASLCWPDSFGSTPADVAISLHFLIRLWTLAVRRWCWLSARLTLREIVHRSGRILLTSTDLDVTLPLEQADLRIRRIGLDIDPGWLPWFGRVVRFHYESSRQNTGGSA